jgi:uncharacterized surface protein with fasciclin (FAS1) repeats
MSRIRPTTRLLSVLTAGALAVGLAATAAPAQAAPGTTSLAEVLAADGNRLDRNWDDFDIVEKAVYRVLAADGESPVALLADGNTALTAFVPTDRAFRRLVTGVSGDRPASERATWRAVRAFGPETLEAVLLYHVVPGATITYKQALGADGATLTTALEGGTIDVNVVGKRVRLRDADTDALNPKVIFAARNVNKGNLQIAHGINRVLRPIDL